MGSEGLGSGGMGDCCESEEKPRERTQEEKVRE